MSFRRQLSYLALLLIIYVTNTSTIDASATTTASITAVAAALSCLDPTTNGGFDTGSLSPWTSRGCSDTYTFVSPGYNSSTYVIWVTFSGSDHDGLVLDQSIAVCPGVTYDYNFRVSIPASSYDFDGTTELDVLTFVFGSFNSYSDASRAFYSPTTGYTEITGSAYANIIIELEFKFNHEERNPVTFAFLS